MGIYISDLDIPKGKAVQIVIIRDDGVCVDEWGNTYGVVSLPPHGRLIDADALMDALTRAKEDDPLQYKEDYFTVSDWLNVAPTVIEADCPPSIPLEQVWTELFGEEGE